VGGPYTPGGQIGGTLNILCDRLHFLVPTTDIIISNNWLQ